LHRRKSRNYNIRRSYSFIVSKENLIEALRQKRAKQIENALERGVMTEKSAERAKKKFNRLLDEIKRSIEQEEKLFKTLVGEENKALKQLFKQIQGGES